MGGIVREFLEKAIDGPAYPIDTVQVRWRVRMFQGDVCEIVAVQWGIEHSTKSWSSEFPEEGTALCTGIYTGMLPVGESEPRSSPS